MKINVIVISLLAIVLSAAIFLGIKHVSEIQDNSEHYNYSDWETLKNIDSDEVGLNANSY